MPLVVLLTSIFATLSILSAVLISPRFGSRYVASLWGRCIAWITPIRVKVSGAEHLREGQSYVITSNHQSQYDIPVIYGWLKLDLKWVIKKELRKIPGIGIGCEKLGHIFVDRKNPDQARGAINKALDGIKDGIGILFFPEGTRSADGQLKSFKKGAFRVALVQGLPVLPVTLKGTWDILPARTFKLFPGRAEMIIHSPIETKDMDMDDLNRLMAMTRKQIAEPLGPPDGTT